MIDGSEFIIGGCIFVVVGAIALWLYRNNRSHAQAREENFWKYFHDEFGSSPQALLAQRIREALETIFPPQGNPINVTTDKARLAIGMAFEVINSKSKNASEVLDKSQLNAGMKVFETTRDSKGISTLRLTKRFADRLSEECKNIR